MQGKPLNTVKKVGVVPSLSVLRVLEYIDRKNNSSDQIVVFGPEFPQQAKQIARLLGTNPVSHILQENELNPLGFLTDSRHIHLSCHGIHNDKDPWESGFVFP